MRVTASMPVTAKLFAALFMSARTALATALLAKVRTRSLRLLEAGPSR